MSNFHQALNLVGKIVASAVLEYVNSQSVKCNIDEVEPTAVSVDEMFENLYHKLQVTTICAGAVSKEWMNTHLFFQENERKNSISVGEDFFGCKTIAMRVNGTSIWVKRSCHGTYESKIGDAIFGEHGEEAAGKVLRIMRDLIRSL